MPKTRNQSAFNAFRLLDALAEGPMTRTQLAAHLDLNVGQVDSLLDAARLAGYVAGGERLSLTEHACRLYVRALEATARQHRALSEELTEAARALGVSLNEDGRGDGEPKSEMNADLDRVTK